MIERFSVLPCNVSASVRSPGLTEGTDLDAHVRSRCAHEPEGRTDVHLDDDVESIIWCGVEHTIVGEPGVVHDVVQFAILPTDASRS